VTALRVAAAVEALSLVVLLVPLSARTNGLS